MVSKYYGGLTQSQKFSIVNIGLRIENRVQQFSEKVLLLLVLTFGDCGKCLGNSGTHRYYLN